MNKMIEDLREQSRRVCGQWQWTDKEIGTLRREIENLERELAGVRARGERAVQEARATAILDQVVLRAQIDARRGRRATFIMRLGRDDYKPVQGACGCNPAWLQGAAKIVWEGCVERGFEPAIESLPRARSGLGIVIYW